MTKTLLKYKHERMDLKRGSCIDNYKGVTCVHVALKYRKPFWSLCYSGCCLTQALKRKAYIFK